MLKREAECAGVRVIEISPHKTRLSQYSHDTGIYTKKPLSQRWHVFADGSKVQRDLYSGYLARFVVNDTLDARQCVAHWPVAEQLLARAASRFSQSAIGAGFPHPNAGTLRAGVRADRSQEKASSRQGPAAYGREELR